MAQVTPPLWLSAICVIVPFLNGLICARCWSYGRRTLRNFILWMLFSFTLTIFCYLLANAAAGNPSFSPI